MKIKMIILAFLICFIHLITCDLKLSPMLPDDTSIISSYDDSLNGKCEPLNTNILHLCKDIAYNETRYPNFLKQKTQEEAAAESIIYLPLIRINCSPVIKLFLCSIYAPPCVKNYSSILKPCREMCEKARNGCEVFMKSFNFAWPDYIDCSNFPSFNSAEACVTDENYQSSYNMFKFGFQSSGSFLNGGSNNNRLDPFLTFNQNIRPKFNCPSELQIIDSRQDYYLIVNDEIIPDCGMPCEHSLFSKEEINFSRSWILIWATLCFCSTLFTMLTFIIETSRFKYPERPIIFLSICYLVVSLAYLIGSSRTNNSFVCQGQKLKTRFDTSLTNNNEFLVQGTDYYPCTILFMMSYFFGMSSSIWWVILTLTWFLAAGLKWGHEAIESISSYFHLAAWAIPAVKMVAILALKKVDSDILSGICHTGVSNMNILRGFILAPLVFYLLLGTCFLLAGFVSLFRIRTVMKHEGNKTDKLEKFMIRIGVFSILYMVPAIIVICVYFYEQSSFNKWIDYWLKKNASYFNVEAYYVSFIGENDRSSLIFTLFMIKYAMLLVVGITSGFWIWSQKTINSWKRFFNRLCYCFRSFGPTSYDEAAV